MKIKSSDSLRSGGPHQWKVDSDSRYQCKHERAGIIPLF
jgi:hypothetical protein